MVSFMKKIKKKLNKIILLIQQGLSITRCWVLHVRYTFLLQAQLLSCASGLYIVHINQNYTQVPFCIINFLFESFVVQFYH